MNWPDSALATPKSMTLTWPVSATSRFDGVRSRCTMRRANPSSSVESCAYSSAAVSSCAIDSTTPIEAGRLWRCARCISAINGVPRTSSIAMKYVLLTRPSSRMRMMFGCSSCAASLASRTKSSTNLRSSASCGSRRLSATSNVLPSSSSSDARWTVAMPPAPRHSYTRYAPNRSCSSVTPLRSYRTAADGAIANTTPAEQRNLEHRPLPADDVRMSELVVYADASWQSPWVFHVVVALEELRVPYRLDAIATPIAAELRAELQRNALLGKVPCLRDDEVWLTESLAISEYLA